MKIIFLIVFCLYIIQISFTDSNLVYNSKYPSKFTRTILFKKFDVKEALFTFSDAKRIEIDDDSFNYIVDDTIKYSGFISKKNNELNLHINDFKEIKLEHYFNYLIQVDTIISCNDNKELLSITLFKEQ